MSVFLTQFLYPKNVLKKLWIIMMAEHPTFCLCIQRLDAKCSPDPIIIFDSSDSQRKLHCKVWRFFLRYFPVASKVLVSSGEGIAKL